MLSKSNRSRSVPSIRCQLCKPQNHGSTLRTSESMHYTPRVTFQEPRIASHKVRGSLPDLRDQCTCAHGGRQRSMLRIHGESSGSTESLLDEADDYLHGGGHDDGHRNSMGNLLSDSNSKVAAGGNGGGGGNNRRFSENDIKRGIIYTLFGFKFIIFIFVISFPHTEYSPSKQSLPFLPKTSKCLKLGHLAKVITKTGRVVIGRVRYIGPMASSVNSTTFDMDEHFVGLQLPSKIGDCDGTIEGRRFFEWYV